MLPGIAGIMAGLSTGKTAAFMGLVAEGDSVSFGDAASDRFMVSVIHWREGDTHRALSSATIGGVSADIQVQRGHTGGLTGLGAAIISATVPSGGSGVVNCTFSGSGVSHVSCGVYRLNGLISTTPTDTGSDQSTGTTSDLSATVSVDDDGIVIAGFTGSTNATSSVAWTGVGEEYDDEDSVHRSSGFASGLSAQSLAVTADVTPQVDSGNDLVVASWA